MNVNFSTSNIPNRFFEMTILIPTIEGERITLRDKIPADRQNYLETGGQAEAAWGFGGGQIDVRSKTPEEADLWMKGRPGWMTWTIALKDGRRIGSVSLHDIIEVDQSATLAIGISSVENMNHGYGTEAMKLVLAHGFDDMPLHRIELRVLARNKRAIRAYEKCGFVYEGTKREAALIDGEWFDDLMMAVLADEFEG